MEIDTVIKRAMLEDYYPRFNRRPFLCSCSPPLQHFLGGPETSASCFGARSDRVEGRRPVLVWSDLEQLPPEILLLVLEVVDIASLAAFASVNSNTRRLVRSMPEIVKVIEGPLVAYAIARMFHAGTAAGFSHGTFMRTIKSSSCHLCESLEHFKIGESASYISACCDVAVSVTYVQCRLILCSFCLWL